MSIKDTPQVESKDLTKSDVFTPTPGMQLWLITAMQLETDSITDIAQACQMSRTAWYEWLDKPGFIDWYNATWNEKIKSQAWRLDTIGMKNAKKDFNYWKSMQQRVGNIQDKPSSLQQFNVNGEMSIEFDSKENQ